MLRRVRDLQGFEFVGQDDEIGSLHDIYFDDDAWTARYFVINTGLWLFGRKVLIAPEAVTDLSWTTQRLYTTLTQKQVEDSPDIDLDKPVSRQQERSLFDYYAWGYYWAVPAGGAGIPSTGSAGIGAAPIAAPPAEPPEKSSLEQEIAEAKKNARDPHLRSVREVIGYSVHATDGDIGQVDDFFVDEADWRIRYLLVDTIRWLPGKKVLISPDWILRVSWSEHTIYVNVPKEKVENSPEYNPADVVDREHEHHLFAHYGFPAYWM